MASPGPIAPPPDGDVNSGPWLLAVFWTEASVAIVFVALRFYTRFSLRNMGVDDWTMLAALILFICTMAICTVLVHYGLGHHIYYLSEENIAQVLKWNWIVQPFGIMTIPFAKISVSLLLLRIIGPKTKWRKWFLYLNMALMTIIFVLASIFSFVQCNPPRALWEAVPGATCWDPSIQADFATFGSAYSAFVDFALALLPITFFWNLKMSLSRKVLLCILLSAGIVSGICASIKTAQSRELGIRLDVTWGTVSLYAWSTSEAFLNIVCGCIPTLKPLYESVVKGQPMTSKYSYQNSANSASLNGLKYGSRKGLLRNAGTEAYALNSAQSVSHAPITETKPGEIKYEQTFSVQVQRETE